MGKEEEKQVWKMTKLAIIFIKIKMIERERQSFGLRKYQIIKSEVENLNS